MKKVLAVIFALVVVVSVSARVVSVSACGANQPEKVDNADSSSRFVIVEDADSWYVVADKDTRVMYVVSDGFYNRSTFTLLVNADGTPLVYTGEW